MPEHQDDLPTCIVGPDDEPLTISELPPPDTRWVARRKAEVVAAVQMGLLTVDEACRRYTLTLEEFTGWQRALYRHGVKGLKATRVQLYKTKDLIARRKAKKPARLAAHNG